ncbi:MAG TPA: 23S rRNA (adenine(2503)-C(2))-methyltransferase RlmN [Chlorobaculum parvum]|uniref:Probable dual-specificity RNA methyltransferase RlmN n=1 Tax=Chlorobaculum parvum TaxID=274539 RepID=A0A7C5DBM5_9CHLB|nr:23S rRNA (adenine(2503)-C(2))-methyltransferase RlmN [Chlorobaculum parvum]
MPEQPFSDVPKPRDGALQNIRELNWRELESLMKSFDQPAYRARQLHQWLYSLHAQSFDEMTSFGKKLREQLATSYAIRPASISAVESEPPQCEAPGHIPTSKFLIRLDDGELIESVLIPSEKRMTACISSQVGCALRCTFCATGLMGFKRDLVASEITDQVFLLQQEAHRRYGRGITNIVFMGMGEPLLNLDNVFESISTLTEQEYRFSISERKITISSVGLVPEIERIASSELKTKLAISLHSANQTARERLMPIAVDYPLEALSKAISSYNTKTGQPVTLVYMLLEGINDSAEDVRKLALFAKGSLCKINLIDYNAIVKLSFRPGYSNAKTMFIQHLLDAGLHVTVRKSQGAAINAACGQLATRSGNDGAKP